MLVLAGTDPNRRLLEPRVLGLFFPRHAVAVPTQPAPQESSEPLQTGVRRRGSDRPPEQGEWSRSGGAPLVEPEPPLASSEELPPEARNKKQLLHHLSASTRSVSLNSLRSAGPESTGELSDPLSSARSPGQDVFPDAQLDFRLAPRNRGGAAAPTASVDVKQQQQQQQGSRQSHVHRHR